MVSARWIGICIGSALALAVAAPASAQFKCDAPTKNAWLTEGLRWDETAPLVPPGRILEIEPAAVPEAIRALDRVAILPLDGERLTRLLGAGRPAAPPENLSPYLVRAVYPTPSPHLSATLNGGVLRVSASGLGCAPFVKHPVVIYLERAPETIEVTADAAL
jgi:hypothetical protein